MNTSATDALQIIRDHFPQEGLFAQKEWRTAPEPLWIPEELHERLQNLGGILLRFVRACHEIYFLSVEGKAPSWISTWLDAGKPEWLIQAQRSPAQRHQIPQVLRPDLMWTEKGIVLSELDSVPGGIGLTAWLNETYSRIGYEVIGGEMGMMMGFQSILQGGDVVLSQESADYGPEMRWILSRMREEGISESRVLEAEALGEEWQPERAYRFFELFDLENIPMGKTWVEATAAGDMVWTPPLKPLFEEKMWLALFHAPELKKCWQNQLSEEDLRELRSVIPQSWVVDPAPLPPWAEFAGLGIRSWDDLKKMGRSHRRFVLKISGFSETAWGARGVVVGHDSSQEKWEESVKFAVESFHHHPHVLQEFHKGRILNQAFVEPGETRLRVMEGRTRLCPYYFVQDSPRKEAVSQDAQSGQRAVLKGILSTMCPSDKKILHGMRDAILSPVAVRKGETLDVVS